MKITIKKECYDCRTFDPSKASPYKCYTPECPVRNMSRKEIDKIILTRKQTKKVKHHG